MAILSTAGQQHSQPWRQRTQLNQALGNNEQSPNINFHPEFSGFVVIMNSFNVQTVCKI